MEQSLSDWNHQPSIPPPYRMNGEISCQILQKLDPLWKSQSSISIEHLLYGKKMDELNETLSPHKDYKPPLNYPHFLCEISCLPLGYFKQFIFLNFRGRQVNEDILFRYNKQGVITTLNLDLCVPTDHKKKFSLWGLEVSSSLQILVLMAWLKILIVQKITDSVQPGDFIKMFTLPTWMVNDVLGDDLIKEMTSENYIINRDKSVLLQSNDSKEVEEVGIVKNRLAYRLNSIQCIKNQHYFVIQSTVDCTWSGKYHFKSQEYLSNYELRRIKLNPYRKFIVSKQQLKGYFSKILVSNINYTNLRLVSSLVYRKMVIKESSQYQIVELQMKTQSTIIISITSNQPKKVKLILSEYTEDLRRSNDFISTVNPEYKYVYIERQTGPIITFSTTLDRGIYILRIEFEKPNNSQINYTVGTTAPAKDLILRKFTDANSRIKNNYQDSKFLSSSYYGYFQQCIKKPPGELQIEKYRDGFIGYGKTFKTLGFGFIAVQIPFKQGLKRCIRFNPYQMFKTDNLKVHRYFKMTAGEPQYPNAWVQVPIKKDKGCIILTLSEQSQEINWPPKFLSFDL